MRFRISVCLIGLSFAASLAAQTNHVSLLLSRTSFESTSSELPGNGGRKLYFDSKNGYGVAFDRFFKSDLAFHASAERIKAHSWLDLADQHTTLDSGRVSLDEYTAGFHWYPAAERAVRPFVGAGVSRIQNATIHSSYNDMSVRFDSKTTWLTDGGVDIRAGAKGALVMSVKYRLYGTHFDAQSWDPVQVLKLNPVTFGAAFRWRL